MKKKILRLVVVLLLIGGAAAYYQFVYKNGRDPSRLMVSGNIEVTEATLGFKIAGRLLERPVDEGQDVAAGQLLARLDPVDLELSRAKAKANLDLAEATLAELEHGNRPQEIADAQAELERAQAAARTSAAEYAQARADDARYKDLRERKVVSAREYELFRTALRTSQAQLAQAQASVSRAREQLSLKQEGARTEQIAQARAQVAVARESLRQIEQQLTDTALRAPSAGVVMSTAAEPGEYLNAGSSVLTLAPMDRVKVRAWVPETALGRVTLGREVQVFTDSRPGKPFPGTVTFISDEAEFTPKSVQTFEERVKLMYRIKIELDNPERVFKAGMPVDALLASGEATDSADAAAGATHGQ